MSTALQTHPRHKALADHRSVWVTLQRSFFPNRTTAFVCIGGLTAECALAMRVSTHALWAGGPASLAAACFLVWFWYTVAHGLRWLSVRFGAGHTARELRSGWVVAILLVMAGTGYSISWGLCLQTGRFAGWEAVWFASANAAMLWDYLLAADARQLVALAMAPAAWAVLFRLLSARLRADTRLPDEQRAYCLRPFMAWLVLGIATLLLRAKICDDLSVPRQVDRMHRMATALNPLVALGASAWLHWSAEPIYPCLSEGELEPYTPQRHHAGPSAAGLSRSVAASGAIDRRATSGSPPHASVVVIAIESLRHDMVGFVHQGHEVLPHVNRLAARSLHLTRAYAQSTHSDYADVCLPSSLYPLRSRSHHFYRRDDPWPKTLLHDVLHGEGYATAIISSQNEAWGGMDQFLETDGLDWFYDPQRSDVPSMISERDPGFWREHVAGTLVAGKFPDRHTTDVALQWIRDQVQQGRPFYLAMNFQSSHFPYLLPDDCPRPFQPATLPAEVKFSSYPAEHIPVVRNAYYNAIHECDRQVGRLVAELERLGVLDETVLVVTGENGEAFHENGCVGHAGLPVEPVVHVAALIHAPGRVPARREDYPFEHVDLAPTILGILGLPPHPNFQGCDILGADRVPLEQRLIFFHVISPIARGDAVLLAGRWKFMTRHDAPQGELYDLQHDPQESTDVAAAHPDVANALSQVLARWRARQLAYYHYPFYYLRYYPPAPPRIEFPQSRAREKEPTP